MSTLDQNFVDLAKAAIDDGIAAQKDSEAIARDVVERLHIYRVYWALRGTIRAYHGKDGFGPFFELPRAIRDANAAIAETDAKVENLS